ncbi:thiamine pyrophosphate-dependent dehydrogenase E1 component subunit alpha [Polynucleobacter sp. MG-6-Vaara-E2]|uniref:thiamine pyrophosphate-dependent dehydrogenase E1 component subunit alpha n=1 Tax=Polynucleobacter sp. MG-6-Vaara-E2 TaxID=2576932 RepID=UPI001BFDDA81|nr:thiamine pyrophosphate-dependent dehydrogenase E1 component subunit alpha [Polynucleobacter sp. MG-6-Vaara-E2]QWD96906.1 thiamine pyrophosphate-dependent dehydrogenase E1 component subunit alpha [Polynucleobacter sp. MG-6-Vaara-E2]
MTESLSINLFAKMYRIRAIEEAIAYHYPEGKMRCPVHLSIGQELIPSVFSEAIRPTDFAVSTHRGHAHYLAKGGNLNAMIAEIYGKSTGCSKGKGGSMHLIDLAVNFMGTSAIVGNSIPIGVGLALSVQLRETDQISCVFLGDGAIEEGVFYESVNFAAVRKLPVLFICENNLYSVYSPLSVRQPAGRSIANMVKAMGVEVGVADGMNIEASQGLMKRSIERVRKTGLPCFLEFSTYRWREHCGHAFDNEIGYRTPEEFLDWQQKDPLHHLEMQLIEDLSLQGLVMDIKSNVMNEVNAAFDFAETSPFPNQHEAYDNVFA